MRRLSRLLSLVLAFGASGAAPLFGDDCCADEEVDAAGDHADAGDAGCGAGVALCHCCPVRISPAPSFPAEVVTALAVETGAAGEPVARVAAGSPRGVFHPPRA